MDSAAPFAHWPRFRDEIGSAGIDIIGFSLDLPDRVIDALHQLAQTLTRGSGDAGIPTRPQSGSHVARGVLAALLSKYPGAHAANYTLSTEPSGKPKVVNLDGSEATLRPMSPTGGSAVPAFSLSYTDNHVVLALSSGSKLLGIDLEKRRSLRYLEDILAYVLSDTERATLLSLPPGLRHERFFTVWCRKEAVVKALGESVAKFMDCFSVSTEVTEHPSPTLVVRDGETVNLSVLDIDVLQGFSGAVCGLEPLGSVTYHRLDAATIEELGDQAMGRSYIR